MDQFESEVHERWGDTDAYRQSKAKTSKYSKEDFEAAKVDQEAATELFVYAFGNNENVNKQNWAKAQLIVLAIVIGLMIVFISVFGALLLKISEPLFEPLARVTPVLIASSSTAALCA